MAQYKQLLILQYFLISMPCVDGMSSLSKLRDNLPPSQEHIIAYPHAKPTEEEIIEYVTHYFGRYQVEYARTEVDQNIGELNAFAMSPDDTIFATSAGRTIKLWKKRERTYTYDCGFREHSGDVIALAFSSDGKLLASGSKDCTIKLWDIQARTLLCTLGKEADVPSVISFSVDNSYLFSGSNNHGTISIWNVQKQEKENLLHGSSHSTDIIVPTHNKHLIISQSLNHHKNKNWLWNLHDHPLSKKISFKEVAKLAAPGYSYYKNQSCCLIKKEDGYTICHEPNLITIQYEDDQPQILLRLKNSNNTLGFSKTFSTLIILTSGFYSTSIHTYTYNETAYPYNTLSENQWICLFKLAKYPFLIKSDFDQQEQASIASLPKPFDKMLQHYFPNMKEINQQHKKKKS